MRRLALAAALVFLLPMATAQNIGSHVTGVTPEHPLDEGRLFGECIAELALTGECLHEHDQ